ncbi:MAG: hypothetical protein AAFY72_15665 [Cyanobacteria bacterium J06649_4]
MGIYLTAARLDSQRQVQLATDADGVVQAATETIYGADRQDWVLDLGKEAYSVEQVLKVYVPEIVTDAVYGIATGRKVGADTGYGKPRYLSAERVSAIAQRLHTLPSNPVPAADPTGYTPDPRLALDPQLQAVHHNLETIGVNMRDEEEVVGVKSAIAYLLDFYQKAKQKQQGLLLFIR